MRAIGTFEIKLEPQSDESNPAGRMLINKEYIGDINGIGVGQMISKRTESGVAVYYAIEEFVGSIAGIKGAFTFLHRGLMSDENQTLDIEILKGSSSGELYGISGSLNIIQENGMHRYELEYQL